MTLPVASPRLSLSSFRSTPPPKPGLQRRRETDDLRRQLQDLESELTAQGRRFEAAESAHRKELAASQAEGAEARRVAADLKESLEVGGDGRWGCENGVEVVCTSVRYTLGSGTDLAMCAWGGGRPVGGNLVWFRA